MTMSHSTLSIHDSVRELLASASESNDCAFLLPVIESLFEQISTIDGDTELAYRQVIKNLASLLIDNNVLTDEGNKHFEWLVKFSQTGHDASVLEALMERFDSSLFINHAKTSTQPSISESTPIASETASQTATEETNRTDLRLDFLQSINGMADQSSGHFHDLLKENHLNDDEIKTVESV